MVANVFEYLVFDSEYVRRSRKFNLAGPSRITVRYYLWRYTRTWEYDTHAAKTEFV